MKMSSSRKTQSSKSAAASYSLTPMLLSPCGCSDEERKPLKRREPSSLKFCVRGAYKICIDLESGLVEIEIESKSFCILLADEGFPADAADKDLLIRHHSDDVLGVSEELPRLFGALHILHVLIVLRQHF